MPTLYISREDGVLGRSGDALSWRPGRGEKKENIPMNQVRDVVILGQGSVTTQALHALMDSDIPVHYLDGSGRYKGSLTSGRGRGYRLRRSQYEAADDRERTLSFARSFVAGKLLNQRHLLLRHLYRGRAGDTFLQQTCAELGNLARNLSQQADIDELRGREGIGAAIYWRGFAKIVRPPWFFSGRNRRPPKDPVNVLLSFAYTLLLNSVTTAMVTVGADPCVGFLHPEYRGRPALALDMMEEFRAPVVDRLVVAACNQGLFHEGDFEADSDGRLRMGQAGKKRLLKLYSERLRTETRNESNGCRSSYENHIRSQAAVFVESLRVGNEYLPFIGNN